MRGTARTPTLDGARPVAVILGLAAAATYGAADFVGGLVTRRAGALTVVLWSQIAGALLLLAALPALAGAPPTQDGLTWGALSGLAGGTGVILLYRGLSIGRMSVVAPVTAVEAAALPVVVGLGFGERPSALALVGVTLALSAVALVSSTSDPAVVGAGPGAPAPGTTAGRGRFGAVGGRPGMLEALGAGLGFGLFFVLLRQAGLDGGLWPLVGVRIGSVGLVLVIAAGRRRPLRPVAGTWRAIVVAGSLDMAANLLYLLATRQGLLSLVAVLTSLYPAATVLLARIVLDERLSRLQLTGLIVAAAGVILIGAG